MRPVPTYTELVPGTGPATCTAVPPPFRGRVQVQVVQVATDKRGEPGTSRSAVLGRRSRRKGKTWERELAALLRPVLGNKVKRGFQSRSGRDGCDVEGTAFWIEAKHHQLVDVRAALRQALAATDGRPVAVVAKDGKKPPGWRPGLPSAAPFVVMLLDDWLALLCTLVGRQEPDSPVVREQPEDL